MKKFLRSGAVLMAFCACGRFALKKKVTLDSSPAQFAQVSGVIHHRDGAPLAAPRVELWNDSGHTRLQEVKSRLADDALSASFLSRPIPPGLYRVRVAAPRCATVEKSVEITAYGPPPALEFILEDSREHRRKMAVKHYKSGLAHLAESRFKEAAEEFSKSNGWDSFFEPLPKAREMLVRAMDRARVLKSKTLEKKGRFAGAYFELGRLREPTPANLEKRADLRRRIALRSGLVVAVADFSDTPSAPGYGEKLRRALGARLSRGVPGLTPAPGPKTAETISGRGIGFDSVLKPAEAARLLSAVRADVIVIARALSYEVIREAKAVPYPPRQAARTIRIANPEYLKWQALASRIKRAAPARVSGPEEDADLVSQLSAQVEERIEKERFENAVGKPPPEFIEKVEGSEPVPGAVPAVKSAKLNAVYRLITAEGISPAAEGAVAGEARAEGAVPGGGLGAECAEKVRERIEARLMELLRAKAEPYLKKALELKSAGNGEEAVEEAANSLMAAPSGPENGKARALLKELIP